MTSGPTTDKTSLRYSSGLRVYRELVTDISALAEQIPDMAKDAGAMHTIRAVPGRMRISAILGAGELADVSRGMGLEEDDLALGSLYLCIKEMLPPSASGSVNLPQLPLTIIKLNTSGSRGRRAIVAGYNNSILVGERAAVTGTVSSFYEKRERANVSPPRWHLETALGVMLATGYNIDDLTAVRDHLVESESLPSGFVLGKIVVEQYERQPRRG